MGTFRAGEFSTFVLNRPVKATVVRCRVKCTKKLGNYAVGCRHVRSGSEKKCLIDVVAYRSKIIGTLKKIAAPMFITGLIPTVFLN